MRGKKKESAIRGGYEEGDDDFDEYDANEEDEEDEEDEDEYEEYDEEDEDGEHAIAEAASEGMDLADHRRTIHIRTIRKEYMLRAETVARRDEWIKRLRYAKQIAIKVHLGHAKQTDEERAAMRAGERLFKRGIRREMTRAKQTLEMHQMMGSGAVPDSVGF